MRSAAVDYKSSLLLIHFDNCVVFDYFQITHMVSAHDLTRSMPIHDHLSIDVLRVRLSDRPETNLVDHINVVNQFIHAARLANGN